MGTTSDQSMAECSRCGNVADATAYFTDPEGEEEYCLSCAIWAQRSSSQVQPAAVVWDDDAVEIEVGEE